MNDKKGDFALYEQWIGLKQKDFFQFGYDQVTKSDLWEYCIKYLWKHDRPQHYCYEVEDILSIEFNDYFTFASLEAQVYNVPSLEEMKFDDLFK